MKYADEKRIKKLQKRYLIPSPSNFSLNKSSMNSAACLSKSTAGKSQSNYLNYNSRPMLSPSQLSH